MADQSKLLQELSAENEALPLVDEPEPAEVPEDEAEVEAETASEPEPDPEVESQPEPVRESSPERVALAVSSGAFELRDEEFAPRVEGDTVQPWAVGSSNASTLTHVSVELAPNLTETQKATRRKLN